MKYSVSPDHFRTFAIAVIGLFYAVVVLAAPAPAFNNADIGEIYISENFTSGQLGDGWYDNTSIVVNAGEGALAAGAAEYKYFPGESYPVHGRSSRHLFSETDQVYLKYYIKYSDNWTGSGRSYHPHEFYILTNKESKWAGLAATYLTIYFEQNNGELKVSLQDGLNIDENNINQNLVNATEFRSIAGCNGSHDQVSSDCYSSGGSYYNGKSYDSGALIYQGSAGKGQWHVVEAFIKLNSIQNGKGIADGVMQVWLDGGEILNNDRIIYRTAQHPDMKLNQLIVGPYMNESPSEQTFWVDDITVASGVSNMAGTSKPMPPTGFSATAN